MAIQRVAHERHLRSLMLSHVAGFLQLSNPTLELLLHRAIHFTGALENRNHLFNVFFRNCWCAWLGCLWVDDLGYRCCQWIIVAWLCFVFKLLDSYLDVLEVDFNWLKSFVKRSVELNECRIDWFLVAISHFFQVLQLLREKHKHLFIKRAACLGLVWWISFW